LSVSYCFTTGFISTSGVLIAGFVFVLVCKQFPVRIVIMPGIISRYPKHAYGPGILCTPTTCHNMVDIIGYIVMAIAITTGSGNSLATNENDINTLMPSKMAKYKKLVK